MSTLEGELGTPGSESDRDAATRDRWIVAALATFVIVGLLSYALYRMFIGTADDPQTTIAPASDNAQAVQDVYVLIFWLAAIVFIAIMALTMIFSIVYRERPGAQARQFHGNSRLEVVWTLIPVAIVAIMAVPTFSTIIDTTGDAPEGSMQVTATGHQWWFEFEYPELGITTANELHVQAGQPVNVSLLSDDVIHSFWVPQLAGKVDMVPGHENHLWFTPSADAARAEPYLGQCAEFCSTSHANMKFRVFVDTPADFEAWARRMATDAAPASGDVARAGEQIATTVCGACHTIGGTSARGVIGPDLTHVGGRSTLAAGIMDNTSSNLATWLADPPALKPGSKMPDLGLSDEQIEQLVAYLKGLE